MQGFNGLIDEARISSVARSADWIETEYTNHSSPSNFYSLSSENGFLISPASVALYTSQSQQFTATSLCNSAMIWSMPAGSPGTLTTSGLYTAPAMITSPQTVIITATMLANSTNTATSTITLELRSQSRYRRPASL